VTCDVVFSLESAAELVRIAGSVGSAASVIQAVESLRRILEKYPSKAGHPLSEGLFYIDEEPLRAFYVIDDNVMRVEITDFRIL